MTIDPQTAAAIAAFLSALAAGGSAFTAWKGPVIAARLAERLRRQGDQETHTRILKLNVFGSLMQDRPIIGTTEAARSLNLIDVVFRESPRVREAWAELYLALDAQRGVPGHVQQERLRILLREMAIDIGIADNLRLEDFERCYYPEAVAEENQLRQMQRRLELRRLMGQNAPAGDVSVAPSAMWPPRPE